MSAFVDTSTVTVTDGENKIYVKRGMDFGTLCDVEDMLTRMAIKDGATGELHVTLGARRLALAIYNIVAWEGPAFEGRPCTADNIRKLKPTLPIFVKARDEISRLNNVEEPADPNSTPTGEKSSQETEPAPVESTTSLSS
jgi:hypothetical protein